MKATLTHCLTAGAVAFLLACAPAEEPPPEQAAVVDPCGGLNTLTDAEKAEGWALLFDGKTMNGWHGYNGGTTEAWSIDDCAIRVAGTDENYGSDKRVDMATDSEYTNFEFVVDWKATTGGNSGLMYAVIEDEKYEAPWETGPEYQFLDDVGWPTPEELKDSNYAGADYDMLAPNDQKELKPVGEWNTTRLVVNGPHVEHWLNGKKVLEFERWTDEWKARRDASKWGEYKDYGLAQTGRIVLQDHGSEFWFRNIKIREIDVGVATEG
jgi:hypothetical protein